MTADKSKIDNRMILFWLIVAHVVFVVLQLLQKTYLMPLIEPLVSSLTLRVIGQILIPLGLIFPLNYFVFVRRLKPVPLTPREKPTIALLAKILILQCGLMAIPGILNLFKIIASGHLLEAPDKASNDAFTVFVFLVFNPIVEEWIGRKLTLERLRPLGDKKAALYSAAFFGFLHLFSQNIGMMLTTFAVSLLWAFITIKTGKLIYAMVLHSLMNFYAFFLPQWLGQTELGAMLYSVIAFIVLPILAIVIYVKDRALFKL